MKKILLLIHLLFVLFVSYAQTEKDGIKASNQYKKPHHPLDSKQSYYRLLKQHFNLTLLGSLAPASGFTVETDKPKITLKGAVPVKNYEQWVFNFDLAGGLDNGNLNIFSGQKLNTLFRFSGGVSKLLPWSKSWHEPITELHSTALKHKKYVDKKKLAEQIDTFLLIDLLIYKKDIEQLNFNEFVSLYQTRRNASKFKIDGYNNNIHGDTPENRLKGILIKLGADSLGLDGDLMWKNLINKVKDNPTNATALLKKHVELLDLYGYEKNGKYIQNKAYDAEIEQVKKQELYLSHRIWWFNLSIIGSNSNFRQYNISNQQLTDTTSFLPGITASINFLQRRFNTARFLYGRGSITYQRTNNLVELTQFAYKKEETITVSPGETLKRAEEGTAYTGSLVQAPSIAFQAEIFWVPWKEQFLPGLYLNTSYRFSNGWISKHKLPLDIGLTFNVNSKDGSAKNLLTIIPYMGWTNLLKEYKDATKAETKKLSELFVVGVRLGIPVNIGK